MLYKLYCKNVGFCLTFLRIFGNFISFTSGISLLLKLYKPLVMHETGSCLIYYPSKFGNTYYRMLNRQKRILTRKPMNTAFRIFLRGLLKHNTPTN